MSTRTFSTAFTRTILFDFLFIIDCFFIHHFREMSSRKTTGRVDSSQITSFLCFTCGDTFGNHLDYHRHLMEHQAVSLIYQLYYLEHEVC